MSAREGLTTTARDGGSIDVAGAIIDHLDLWTGAVTKKSSSGRGSNGKVELTGVKKLREFILELALRGKLTEQLTTDEPAQEYLKRVKTEREVLGEGPAKRKGSATSPVDDKPFSIPKGWSWERLGNIGLIASSRRVRQRDWQDHGIPFYRAREIVKLSQQGHVNNELFISESLFSELEQNGHIPEVNDLMLTGVGTIGVPYIVKQDDKFYFKDASVLIFKNFLGVSPQFLYYFCHSPFWKNSIHEDSMGTTVHTLTIIRANQALIPVPPIEEQHRIVQKVDELMALCDRLEQQTSDQLEAHETLVDTLLGTLTQSENATELADNWARLAAHFDTLFTTEQSIDKLKQTILRLATAGKLVPFQGAAVPLKNILSFGPRNGFSPKESSYETGCKVLKLGATTKGWLDLLESKNVDIGNSVPPHLWLKKGDILIQRGNAANHVGCNVLLDSDYPNYIYPDLMMKVRVKEEVAIPSFVALYLSAPGARQFMWERMTGTSGTMPKISKKVVEEIPVSLPDIETQKAVVQKVDELMALCDQLKERLIQASETRYHLAEAVVDNAVN